MAPSSPRRAAAPAAAALALLLALLAAAAPAARAAAGCRVQGTLTATDDLGSATNRYDRTYDVAEEAECACDGAAFQMLVDAVAREIADALGRPVSLMPLAVSTGLISYDCTSTTWLGPAADDARPNLRDLIQLPAAEEPANEEEGAEAEAEPAAPLPVCDGPELDTTEVADSSCAEFAEWEKCDESWIIDGGFCAETCGRCVACERAALEGSAACNATANATLGPDDYTGRRLLAEPERLLA